LLKRPGFWLTVLVLTLITGLHYRDTAGYPQWLDGVLDNIKLDRHSFERILYLAPVVWSGFLFGQRGVVATSAVALACMLPRAIGISDHPTDAVLESIAVFTIGMVVALSFKSLREEHNRRTQLEMAEKRLQLQLQVIKENERKLGALNQTAAILSESLQLDDVLNRAVRNAVDVTKVDVAMIALVDEEAGELVVSAHLGASQEFVQAVGRMKVHRGLQNHVSESGELMLVEDAFQHYDVARQAVKQEGIRSHLVVPMKAKGRVVGTLYVATRSVRRFLKDDVELLTAIANQIAVATDNARLYEMERLATQRLAVSERNYRGLFENAYDAIWVHDPEGNYIVANRASEKVTGYSVAELLTMNVRDFLSEEGLGRAREVKSKLMAGEPLEQPYELRMVRRDGSEAILKVTTSMVAEDGRAVGFHNIARDVTEEIRLKENLRLYLSQVTKAQEEERKRIARELHDDTIQALVVLSRQLEDAASAGKGMPEDKRSLLESLRQQATGIMDGVRRLTQDLRPSTLDRLGLLAGLEWLASDVSRYSGIDVKVRVGGASRRLSPDVELTLFRIAQESLRNVWRHSGATEAEVSVDFQGSKVAMIIKDNGKGFAVPSSIGDLTRDGKLGLTGMQERAGLLGGNVTFQSEPGKGTAVVVDIAA
jgi:PAS domain S-box-containing protein